MVDALVVHCPHCGEPNLVPLTENARRATHADVRIGTLPQGCGVDGEGSHYEGSFDPHQTEAFPQAETEKALVSSQRALQLLTFDGEDGG